MQLREYFGSAMETHGSVYEVDADLIETLDPDVILTQAVCEVCAVPTAGVAATVAARGLRAEVVSLDAHTIEDILASVRQVGRGELETADAPALARVLDLLKHHPEYETRWALQLNQPFIPAPERDLYLFMLAARWSDDVRNDEEFDLSVNESTYVAIGDVHRIANPYDEPVHIIEVQCGDYLGEDDIVRLEDNYGREGTNT